MTLRDEYLNRIHSEFIPPLRTFIDLNFSSIHQDREDTLQDILEKLVARIYSYDNRYALSTWVYAVARNHCLDLLRKQKRQPSFSGLDEGNVLVSSETSPEDILAENQDQTRMRQLMARLPREERQVLFLKYYEDMTFKEIARVMSRPVGTVKYLSFKAKSWIEAQWEDNQ
ncbi:MAG: RNA polymerase sigma factor [Spirochaetales bacterium]|nr:RNA polymerase sigma factor [Spirochaetales bacterium]